MNSNKKIVLILIMIITLFGLLRLDTVYATDTKKVSNIVVFAKFKDDTKDVFNAKSQSYSNWTLIKNMYNKNEGNGGDNSFKNYINIISEGKVEVDNYFPQ